MTKQTTVVIGAGIIGCSIAQALAAAGEAVVVLDAARVGAGVSGSSFGWINASFHADEAHYHLRKEGIAAWHRLEAARGDLPISWGGAFCWEEQGAALMATRDGLSTLGYQVDAVGGDALQERLPALGGLPAEALFFAEEGVADVAALTEVLARDASALGARFVTGVTVEAICEVGGRVTGVKTAHGEIAGDRVVVAAGSGGARLVEALGVKLPMLSRPGLLMKTRPIARVLETVLVTPEGEIRQMQDGRIVMPTSAGHQGDTTEAITELPLEIAEAALDRIRGYFLGQDLAVDEVTLAWRPVPGDGLPVVGPAGPEGLYLSVLHSGVTLAAVVAELAAREMLEGERSELLGPYHPGRFQ